MYSKELIYNLIKGNRNKIFNARTLKKEKHIECSLVQIRRVLTNLYRERSIFRSKTQLQEGYIYSISKKKIDEAYKKYLLPQEFGNRKKLIGKITKYSFRKLPEIKKFELPKENLFVKKYGSKYLYRKDVQEAFASLVSFIMGDGHLKGNMSEIQFSFRYKTDAQIFRKKFLKYFFKEKMILRKGSFCYVCALSNKEFAEILFYLGAPKGRKISQEFLVPKWIMYGSKNLKKIFLSTIIGNEGSKPQNNKWRIQFVLSKEKNHVENLLDFLNEIKELLFQFNILTSHTQLRTQPGRNYYGRFYIKGKENLRKFYNSFEFLYASEKQEVLELLIQSNSLKCNNAMTK
jgi:hypothetical protein